MIDGSFRTKLRTYTAPTVWSSTERLRTALAEMAVKLTLAEGKEPWD
jgi:hypothetical protein